MAQVVLIADGRQRRHLRDQAVDGAQHLMLRTVRVLALGVEGAQRVHHRRQDAHRVGVRRVVLEEALHVLMHQRMVADVALELLQLLLRGQLAEQQQVGYLDERGLLSQLLDGVAPVLQDALLTVQEGDGAGGGTGVLVTEVQRDVSRDITQLADVDGLLAFTARHDREFVRLAVEDDLRLFAHRCCLDWNGSSEGWARS